MRGTPHPQHWTTQVPPVNEKEVEEESINQSINQSRYDAQYTQNRNFFFLLDYSGVGRWERWGSKHGFRLQKEVKLKKQQQNLTCKHDDKKRLLPKRKQRKFFFYSFDGKSGKNPTPSLYFFFFFIWNSGQWGGVQTGKQLQFDCGAGLGSGCVRV